MGYKSLNPTGLAGWFDAETHGDKPIVTIEESKEGYIKISYAFPGYSLSDDSYDVEGKTISFKQVNVAKTGFLAESGKPLLPSFGRYVQIPFNCDCTISVDKGQPVQFDDVLVLPAQEKLMDGSEEEHVFEYDQDFYARDEFYPSLIVAVTGPFEIDGYNALLVHVRPFRYNPAKRRLIGFGNIAVTIEVSLKEEVDSYPFSEPSFSREAFGNLFLNPRRGNEARLGIEAPRIPPAPTPPGLEFEFLIIYADEFKEAAEKLASWKNRRGLRTETVSIEDVGNAVEEIKTYIRNKRKGVSSRLRYVLLFGDVDKIKTEHIDSNTTDYYYSTEREPCGSDDLVFPWLSVGRIPVQTEEEGMEVVGQIIRYEEDPPTKSDYYRQMMFAAYFEDADGDRRADVAFVKTMESILKHMTDTLKFRVERIYVSDTPDPQEYRDKTCVLPEVKKAIVSSTQARETIKSITKEGRLIIAHRGHGLEIGWTKPPFDMTDLDSIANDNPTPTMFYSVNCLTGQFDFAEDSFAEKLLKIKGGAPSLIAATRRSDTWLNNHLMKALFDAMWGGVIPAFSPATASYPMKYNRLGDILNYGKLYLPVRQSGDQKPFNDHSKVYKKLKDHFEIYHVIGDPTLELWRAKPRTMKLRIVPDDGDLSITMLSTRYIMLSACPTDSVITVWHGDELIKRIEPSSAHLTISLRDIPPSSLISICFWAPGYRFCQKDVRI